MKSFFKKKQSKTELFDKLRKQSEAKQVDNKQFTPCEYKVEYLSDVMGEIANICSILTNSSISYATETNKDVVNVYQEHHSLSSSNWNAEFKETFSTIPAELLKEIYSAFPVSIVISITSNDVDMKYIIQSVTARIYASIAEINNLFTHTETNGKLHIFGNYFSFIRFKSYLSSIEKELEDSSSLDEESKYLYKILSFIPDSVTELPDIRAYKAALIESNLADNNVKKIIPLRNRDEITVKTFNCYSTKYFKSINVIHTFNIVHIINELSKYVPDCEHFKIIEINEDSHIIIHTTDWMLHALLTLITTTKEIGYQTRGFVTDELLPFIKPTEIVEDDNSNNNLNNEEYYSTHFIEGVDEEL